MKSVEFAELLAKTNYSFLEGASYPEEMAAQAAVHGYRALGIVDRNGVYGLPRSLGAGDETKLKIINGVEITLPLAQTVYLLARDREGYGDLCELLSDAHMGLDDPDDPLFFSLPKVLEKARGLYALIPALGADEKMLGPFKDAFGDRLSLVASRFHDGKDSTAIEAAEDLLRRHDIPCIASNQPLFHAPQRKPMQDVLSCIRHNCTLREAGYRLLPNRERYLKSREDMTRIFSRHPEWLARTVEIADGCSFRLDEIRYRYPVEWIPAGETGDGYLAKITWKGAILRYGEIIPAAVRAQIERELALVRELGYSDYFLTIWDIVEFARRQNILCQGRGSAANSIICYLLGITAIDPVDMNLLFERFISRERKEPPDIDIDFEHERREEVIQYIYGRYGRDRAAITAEVICFRKKSALREVAKVFEIPIETAEALQTLAHRRALEDVTREEMAPVLADLTDRRARQYLAVVEIIQGFPRHLGTHVGGFVLCQEKLTRSVPVEKAAMVNRTVVQWDKNDLDLLGFVRVDILGLGILTAIRKSFDYIERNQRRRLTLATVPREDPKVYDMFCNADTVGVFQIESRAQMNMLPRLKPRKFYDIVIEVSIVRPGPIQGEMVHPYLRRRAGRELTEYAHPLLEKILHKTCGVPLFQEQIMKIAMEVAGFTPGQADELRRAMGAWRSRGKDRLIAIAEKFRDGLEKRGIERVYAERIMHQIEGFAEYGFPESHAASFAILAYVTGWLKLHHPAIFLTALLNAQPMGFYSAHSLIHDGRRHGVACHPVDLALSDWDNRVAPDGQVRLGFREIKGFREDVGRALERLRPFRDLDDVAARVPHLTKRDLFLLASADTLGSFGLDRRAAYWGIQALSLRDSPFFSPSEGATQLPRESDWEKVCGDYEAQGLSLFAHPLALLREELRADGIVPSLQVRNMRAKKRVRTAGMVIARQMPPTKTGVLFITLEDEHGFTNLVVWNEVFQRYRETLLTQSFLLCEGMVQKAEDGDVTHLIVEHAASLLKPTHSMFPPPASHDFH